MDPTYNMQYSGDVPAAAAGGFALFMGGIALFIIVIALAIYVYYAVSLMKIANKTNTPNAWMAWIPIANLILMIQVAQKPLWWIILFFIPIVNIVVSILIWMEIAKAVGKPDWWGILIIVPIVNLIVPGYLAFSSSNNPTTPAQPTQAA
jgi:magnesium-transporting ATPase (P-type)